MSDIRSGTPLSYTLQEAMIPEGKLQRALSRPRALAGLIAATVLLPLALVLLGLWQGQRGADAEIRFQAERQRLDGLVTELKRQAPQPGRFDPRQQFRSEGKTYVGPLALAQAQSARDHAAHLATLMGWRRLLPPVGVAGGALAAGLSLLVLFAGAILGRLGRASRDSLVRGFSLLRRLLPATLALQILAATASFVAAVAFEAAILFQGRFDGGAMKLLVIAVAAVGAAILVAGSTILGLRRALGAFEPDPLPILGRTVTPAEAPALWRLLDGLADRLGALKPEAVVVGLTEGFFVSAGPAVLEPGGARIEGRILYLPLPHLALMRGDEVAAIIGHELAHYAGDDTTYSQRFLPIYAGVERSLDAVAEGHRGSLGLLGPSFRLGLFVMDRFHLAVRHWSRAREFAADAAGARVTSADASARALLRSGAVAPRIRETLEHASEAPDAAGPDLVAAALDHTIRHGLDDPAAHWQEAQAHPTDTHPPTRERVAALGRTIDADLLGAARAVPPSTALGGLGAYFADPAGLSRAATADFLSVLRARDAAFHAHLEATVAEVGREERVLRAYHRPRGLVLAVSGGLFAIAAAAMALFGVPALPTADSRIVAMVALGLGALLGGAGALVLRRGEPVTLILGPESLRAPGLDRAIPWDDIADLDLALNRSAMVMRLLLPPGASWPQPLPGRHGVKLETKHRIVTLTFGLPRGMKPQDFAALIGRYQDAAQARRLLAETGAGARTSAIAPQSA
ncbi:Zn-dependent protease with chaperone function [Methylobacterium gossipiicola]|uniref:Zn-dependent protease with chaperone function n=1 Tax=Methylobacterium gossipiicola TaxID=582675 RepID=A0A1I2X2M3_9HYPH|nr:Zn-dependent protease with chaperone function [Methylobacterium gossipiicola]